jgi:DNA-binding GntR family transcriptional regulator
MPLIMPKSLNKPLKHRTLSSAIVDQLRQEILDGAYPAGTQLRQDALAEAFGVSRIPVREALFLLEAEGFVHMVPHKGAVVSALSLDEINDVFDLRVTLEARLLAGSVAHLTDSDLDGAARLADAFEQAMAAGDIARWGVLNADFHMALYAGAMLPRTVAVVTGLLQTSDRYTRLQLSRGSFLDRSCEEHRGLVELCRRRESAEACSLLRSHIENVRRDLLQVLRGKLPVHT